MLTNKLSVAIADKVIVLSKLKEAEEAHGAVEGGRVNCAVHVGDALGDITAMRAENESLRGAWCTCSTTLTLRPALGARPGPLQDACAPPACK